MKPTHSLWPLMVSLALVSCSEQEPAPADSGADPAPADPKTYLIYDPSFTPEVGRVYSDVVKHWMSDGKVTITSQGERMTGTMDFEERTETTMHQLNDGAKREIITEETGSRVMIINGNPAPDDWEPSVLLNEAVILSKKDGKWEAKLENGTPSPEQQKRLEQLAKQENENSEEKFYGTRPRQVGEAWTTDLSGLSFFGEEKSSEGEATLTLNRVGEHEGQLCAFMTGTFKYAAAMPESAEGMKGTMKLDLEFDFIRSLDQQVDLKCSLKGDILMNMEFPWGSMVVDSPMMMEVSALVK
ncbi:MAG: hypothetical protein R3242_11560 [Akkermansiaceae bacterium]|nr:hypothetical protein [Akkermansiaceae bacterium]